MKKVFFVISYWLMVIGSSGQTVSQKLQKAFTVFEKDSQLKHGISSLYVIDANTGLVVFDKNSQIGLAPASTQKIITSVTAFELLGKDYRYKTKIGYDNQIKNGELLGDLYIEGNGDPTLGSKRWSSTKDSSILLKMLESLRKNGINKIRGDIWLNDIKFGFNPLPDGWIWQDIGNYYGAGATGLNWCENQYDLILKPGKYVGEVTSVIKTDPVITDFQLGNLITTGEKSSGDNGYIYYAPLSNTGFSTGTIPAGVNSFSISGSIPYPSKQFGYSLSKLLASEKIITNNKIQLYSDHVFRRDTINMMMLEMDSILSPSLDSIIYWLNKKSINLYAEALLKTFAYEKKGFGSTDSGVVIVQNFWKERGLDEDELGIVDGSGLSPLNRVTTHSQVGILKYAKTKDWFPYFYNSLPEYNGMSMKSGTIRGVKGFCGYHKAKNGKEYIFSFLVNNYNGSSSSLVNKMYKVLDILK
jgi:D-alanyl-D-alanine carboxypeptidase/D-alanyl-D-alanine-endopeptidase (penicillin-binding protein 4)